MEIGTINMTAMIGPYVEPLATVTEKFGIPYFVTAPLDNVRYRPYNLLYVLPPPLDVMLVAADVARRYLWKDVAVIYTVAEGIRHFKYHIYGLVYRNAKPFRHFVTYALNKCNYFDD